MADSSDIHRTDVLRSKNWPHRWSALCDCGWVGRDLDSKRDADEDGDEHARVMSHG